MVARKTLLAMASVFSLTVFGGVASADDPAPAPAADAPAAAPAGGKACRQDCRKTWRAKRAEVEATRLKCVGEAKAEKDRKPRMKARKKCRKTSRKDRKAAWKASKKCRRACPKK